MKLPGSSGINDSTRGQYESQLMSFSQKSVIEGYQGQPRSFKVKLKVSEKYYIQKGCNKNWWSQGHICIRSRSLGPKWSIKVIKFHARSLKVIQGQIRGQWKVLYSEGGATKNDNHKDVPGCICLWSRSFGPKLAIKVTQGHSRSN